MMVCDVQTDVTPQTTGQLPEGEGWERLLEMCEEKDKEQEEKQFTKKSWWEKLQECIKDPAQLRFWILVSLNMAVAIALNPCRMHKHKSRAASIGLCELCISRGGWIRCRRSRPRVTN